MNNQLEKLQLDLVNYREAVDQIVSSTLTTPTDWQHRLLEVLVCASQLYLDYVLVVRNLPALEAITSKGSGSARVRADMLREKDLRENLRHELESSPSWKHFRPENPFSEITGLRSLQDYTDRFTLHLPEIYEETFQAEVWTKDFLANRSASALAQLVVALQHLGRNHIGFVLQALEWASDEGSWEESLVASKATH
jgi:hypothetical protein